MRRSGLILSVVFFFFAFFLASPMGMKSAVALTPEGKKLIFDEVGLLKQEEYKELTTLAKQYGEHRETDIIILTTNNDVSGDVIKMTEDFYDEYAPGYDKPHGNAVILTLDMKNRDVYLAGFYKAKTYLDDERLDKIRNKITPDLNSGDYALAFQTYMQTVDKYMGYEPGVNPDNPLFNVWVQLGASSIIGGIIVAAMVFRSGGCITINRRTYEDANTSGILDRRDQYIRTTVTKQKIQRQESNGSGGGGGGGTTSGGHSHSGSRGSF
ncbi:TPM domain-containing protein [Brevibacillus sp. SIMBA_040]|uniref:TPM domain-containing protein n=1 Tax=unclassified Brevibacillus TaxID=2684853 RepID=UPI00397D3484